MNIKKPKKIKFKKFKDNPKKYYLIGAGILVPIVAIGLLIFIFGEKVEVIKEIKEQNLSIFKSLNTSDDFFNLFKKDKPKIKSTPKEKTKSIPKAKTKSVPKKIKLKFDDVFNGLEAQSKTPTSNIRDFLNKANHSSMLRVFKKFEVSNNFKKIRPIETIETHYKSNKTVGTYPIDFSRTITADRNIGAILINDINSALAGKVVAQIEDNIYASHGRFILIPIGSKAIGYYQPIEKAGNTRLQILWSRIITPKGIVITINAELSDQMGRSGLAGEIDTKFWDKYGMTLLFSTISAVAQVKFNTNKNQEIIANTYGKDLANVSAKILSENINIKPVISILAGTRIMISPLQDIWFRTIDGTVTIQPLDKKSLLN